MKAHHALDPLLLALQVCAGLAVLLDTVPHHWPPHRLRSGGLFLFLTRGRLDYGLLGFRARELLVSLGVLLARVEQHRDQLPVPPARLFIT
jgi:hypothetical protein